MKIEHLIQKINNTLEVDILTKSRKREVVYGRLFFANELNTKHNYSLAKIGSFINKDHATIIYYLKQYEILKNYDDFKIIINKVNSAIENLRTYNANVITDLNTCIYEIRRY